MTDEPSLYEIVRLIERQGNQIEHNGKVMDDHIKQCTAAHKQSGQRIWAVCLILLSGMVSLGLYVTENQGDKARAIQAVANVTAGTAKSEDSKLDAIAAAVGARK